MMKIRSGPLAQHVENLNQRPTVLPPESRPSRGRRPRSGEVVDRLRHFPPPGSVCRVPPLASSFPGEPPPGRRPIAVISASVYSGMILDHRPEIANRCSALSREPRTATSETARSPAVVVTTCCTIAGRWISRANGLRRHGERHDSQLAGVIAKFSTRVGGDRSRDWRAAVAHLHAQPRYRFRPPVVAGRDCHRRTENDFGCRAALHP